MFPPGRRWLACCVLALVIWPARAQTTLLGEFALKGSLANNVAGGPSLISLGGTITANGYVFGIDQGLTFTSASLSTTSYSIELSFKSNLDSTRSWSKLVDVAGQNSDNGLYIYNSGGYVLQFYNFAQSPSADFTAGTNVDVVLTRDSGGVVTGYVNGVQRFSFTDGTNQAVITATNKTLYFFVDDTIQNSEASSGTANYIRIYSGTLTASEVSALYASGAPSAVPEPAATGLLIGVAALGGLAWRRHRTSKPGRTAE